MPYTYPLASLSQITSSCSYAPCLHACTTRSFYYWNSKVDGTRASRFVQQYAHPLHRRPPPSHVFSPTTALVSVLFEVNPSWAQLARKGVTRSRLVWWQRCAVASLSATLPFLM